MDHICIICNNYTTNYNNCTNYRCNLLICNDCISSIKEKELVNINNSLNIKIKCPYCRVHNYLVNNENNIKIFEKELFELFNSNKELKQNVIELKKYINNEDLLIEQEYYKILEARC